MVRYEILSTHRQPNSVFNLIICFGNFMLSKYQPYCLSESRNSKENIKTQLRIKLNEYFLCKILSNHFYNYSVDILFQLCIKIKLKFPFFSNDSCITKMFLDKLYLQLGLYFLFAIVEYTHSNVNIFKSIWIQSISILITEIGLFYLSVTRTCVPI